jgi:redox-sensing transcriptional repressor
MSATSVVLHPTLGDRLETYLEAATQLAKEGHENVTSCELGDRSGVKPAQVRRDLAAIRLTGTRGVGYATGGLLGALREVLGSRERRDLVVVGAGRLGRAIATSEVLREAGFVVLDVFDGDPEKVGHSLGEKTVRHVDELRHGASDYHSAMGVVATWADAAQKAAWLLAGAGVRVIVSYADASLRVPDGVRVQRMEPVAQLLHTLYYLTRARAGCAIQPRSSWTAQEPRTFPGGA